MTPPKLDPEKVRSAIRGLHRERLLRFAELAFEALGEEQRIEMIRDFIPINRLLAVKGWVEPPLVDQVRAFEAAARSGKYYDDSPWRAHVHGVSSPGTDNFRVEFERLERACVDGVGKIADIELRQSFEILFGLLRAIDACCDDIIFFDDEGGSWQLGVDWLKIAPAYARVLAPTSASGETASLLDALIRDFEEHERGRIVDACIRVVPNEHRVEIEGIRVAASSAARGRHA